MIKRLGPEVDRPQHGGAGCGPSFFRPAQMPGHDGKQIGAQLCAVIELSNLNGRTGKFQQLLRARLEA
jgi:hypothetical protein